MARPNFKRGLLNFTDFYKSTSHPRSKRSKDFGFFRSSQGLWGGVPRGQGGHKTPCAEYIIKGRHMIGILVGFPRDQNVFYQNFPLVMESDQDLSGLLVSSFFSHYRRREREMTIWASKSFYCGPAQFTTDRTVASPSLAALVARQQQK